MTCISITERFGSQKIDEELIEKFEKVTGKKGMVYEKTKLNCY